MTAIETNQGVAPNDPVAAQLVHRIIGGTFVSRAVYAVCKLGVPDVLGGAAMSAGDLASAAGANADVLRRYLRALVGVGLFREDFPDCFTLTALGDLLRADVEGSLHPFAILSTEVIEPSPAAAIAAARGGQQAFVHDHGHSFYEHLLGEPALDELFAAGMAARASRLQQSVVATIDWSDVAHVVDVGGNHGAFLAAILQQNAHTTGCLFDQPHVVAGAGALLESAGVADRVDVEAGDFFAAVPTGGDLYLVANVLWNWSDERAEQILRCCHAAMARTARLVVCEPVVPAGNEYHPARVHDLANLWINGGRTRTEQQWRDLLARSGFDLSRIGDTAGEWSVIEATPRTS